MSLGTQLLIAETGACNRTPMVLVERAGQAELRGDAARRESLLRRAHEAFVELGASGRARALALQLSNGRST